jgi:hypothetical protein
VPGAGVAGERNSEQPDSPNASAAATTKEGETNRMERLDPSRCSGFNSTL